MQIWQVDCYRSDRTPSVWELFICEPTPGEFRYRATCPQSDVNSEWLLAQLSSLPALPETIQVFRPQTLHLLEPVGKKLGIAIVPTRRTTTLKEWIVCEGKGSIAIEQPPPLPLPETLWGDRWRFATIGANDLISGIGDRPMPFKSLPKDLLPLNLGLPSTLSIPGVVIDGGRQSLQFCQWLAEVEPVSLNFIPGQPDGLILESGLVDRWVIATFEG